MNISEWLLPCSMPLLRALGVVATLPLGRAVEGALSKFFLALGLTLFSIGVVPPQGLPEGGRIVTELLIGLCIGLPLALAVNCAAMLGELCDTQRGQNFAVMYNPGHDAPRSPLGRMFSDYTWITLLALGGFEVMLGNYLQSFELADINSPLALSDISQRLLLFLSQCLLQTFSYFLPLAAMLLVIDLSFGFLAKAVPFINLTSETLGAKSAACFLILLLSWDSFSALISLDLISSPLFRPK